MTLKETIDGWMKETRDSLIVEYDRHGLRASGEYAESLEAEIEEAPGRFTARMKAANQAWWMEHGRAPNKEKSPAAAKKLYPIITQWVEDKGLTFKKGVIFAICLKIVYEGINVPNRHNPGGVVSNVINDAAFKVLFDRVGKSAAVTIKADLTKKIMR